VYVIGNHDHTLWTNYILKSSKGRDSWAITPCSGKKITTSDPVRVRNQPSESEELLGLFFNYPFGSAWNRVIEIWKNGGQFDFVAANPMYAQEYRGRMYVFAHGTHFRDDVCSPQALKRILQETHILDVVKLHIKAGMDIGKAKNLEDLEHRVWDFVDSLWPSARNNPSPLPDQVWFLRRALRIGLEAARATPNTTKLMHWDEFPRNQDRITPLMNLDAMANGKLELTSDSITRWRKFFVPHMMNCIKTEFPSSGPLKPITFVFGDNHEGGWGQLGIDTSDLSLVPLPPSRLPGNIVDTKIVNTGTWIIESPDRHPPCHVFAVDESGTEHILDISFKDVNTGGEPLLKLAEKEYEQRESRVGSSFINDIGNAVRKWLSSSDS
jgi:hypothetical protein